MYISVNWLNQYLRGKLKVKNDALKDRVSNSLAEVEDIEILGEGLSNIVVGKIKKIDTHPRASTLSIVIVDTAEDQFRNIVCAAKNIYEGALVPVVLPGGTVYNPKQELGSQDKFEIKETEIRKVKSEGMLASEKELGISEDHAGILILTQDLSVGEDFVKHISDTILEIENKSLTHRPDCFSHIGIARELSAIFSLQFSNAPSPDLLVPEKKLKLSVTVGDKKLCKRYTAVCLSNIKVVPSPFWLRKKLQSIGIRPVNNIVDATNYIMADLGQPIHAFDYKKLKSPRITVRTAKSRETLVTLDGKKRDLGANNLLICDATGPIGVAGVMGGQNTEVDDKTDTIIIESANFEMYNIRRTARKLGIRSEASVRFEKGPDPNLALDGLKKVAQLILDLTGGSVASELIDIYETPVEETSIEFDTADVHRLLGVTLSKEDIIGMLQSLKLTVEKQPAHATKVNINVPTFRRDLHIREDILEEIARLYGYDKFKPTLPSKDISAITVNPRRALEKKIKRNLTSLGFDEIYTYSFTGEESYKNSRLAIDDCIKLKNPVSSDLGYMRSSIVPAHCEKLASNLNNFDTVAFFEIARTYLKKIGENGLPIQPKTISILLSQSNPRDELFFHIKGVVDTLLQSINVQEVEFVKTDKKPYLSPKQQGKIMQGKQTLGYIGILHPQVLVNWKIKQNASLVVLDFERLAEIAEPYSRYTQVPVYPEVRRDLSFWIDSSITAKDVISNIESTDSTLGRTVAIKDIFESLKKKGKLSYTIEIRLQPRQRTLNEKDIQAEIKSITDAINKLGGILRK